MSLATKPTGISGTEMAQSNARIAMRRSTRDWAVCHGWQKAVERVKPLPRDFSRLNLSQQVLDAGLRDPLAVVLFFEMRFFEVDLTSQVRNALAVLLERVRNSPDVAAANGYAEGFEASAALMC